MLKRVLIATPCLDQKVDAYFVDSLCESIKLGLKHDLDIKCVFLANESILPMARNELLNLAYQQKYDVTVFIDDDEYWDEQALIDIILSDKDVVTVPVVNKNDKEVAYNIWLPEKDQRIIDPHDGYIQVNKSGTGFLKLSKSAVEALWNSNESIEFRGNTLKNICEYTHINNGFVGEDITLSNKIRKLGYKIWCNPHHTVFHIGNKMYQGNFKVSHKL
jgi:hypothetical protein